MKAHHMDFYDAVAATVWTSLSDDVPATLLPLVVTQHAFVLSMTSADESCSPR